MTIDQAVRRVFAMMAANYGRKWDIPPDAVNAWATQLEAEGVTSPELLAAASAWARSNPWPPCFAELRSSIPRLCRCGTCYPCHARALERAKRAVDQGRLGAHGFDPEPMSDVAVKLLGQNATQRTAGALPGKSRESEGAK